MPEQLKLDSAAEQGLLSLRSEGVVLCSKVAGLTTRHLLEVMVAEVHTHLDWIDRQLKTIQQVGRPPSFAEEISSGGSSTWPLGPWQSDSWVPDSNAR